MVTTKMAKSAETPKHHWSSLISSDLHKSFWAAWPHECCGLVRRTGEGGVTFEPLPNVAVSQRQSFEIASQDILRLCRSDETSRYPLVAWIHSHPTADGGCSKADRAGFWVGDHWLWPRMEQGILWLDGQKRLNLSLYAPQKQTADPKVSFSAILSPTSD